MPLSVFHDIAQFSECRPMYLVVIGWLYVTVMMAVAEAASPQGSLLGAAVTFIFYGLVPVAIVAYILGTPARKRALRERERAQNEAEAYTAQAAETHEARAGQPPPTSGLPGSTPEPHAGGEAPAAGAEPLHRGPVRKEP